MKNMILKLDYFHRGPYNTHAVFYNTKTGHMAAVYTDPDGIYPVYGMGCPRDSISFSEVYRSWGKVEVDIRMDDNFIYVGNFDSIITEGFMIADKSHGCGELMLDVKNNKLWYVVVGGSSRYLRVVVSEANACDYAYSGAVKYVENEEVVIDNDGNYTLKYPKVPGIKSVVRKVYEKFNKLTYAGRERRTLSGVRAYIINDSSNTVLFTDDIFSPENKILANINEPTWEMFIYAAATTDEKSENWVREKLNIKVENNTVFYFDKVSCACREFEYGLADYHIETNWNVSWLSSNFEDKLKRDLLRGLKNKIREDAIYYKTQELVELKDANVDELLELIEKIGWFTLKDSLAAGNCVPGTKAWVEKLGLKNQAKVSGIKLAQLLRQHPDMINYSFLRVLARKILAQ